MSVERIAVPALVPQSPQQELQKIIEIRRKIEAYGKRALRKLRREERGRQTDRLRNFRTDVQFCNKVMADLQAKAEESAASDKSVENDFLLAVNKVQSATWKYRGR